MALTTTSIAALPASFSAGISCSHSDHVLCKEEEGGRRVVCVGEPLLAMQTNTQAVI